MSQFKPVEDGVFIGPQPTAQDLDDAKQQGIETVIDFRMPTETTTSNETLTRGHGLDYVNIPVDKAGLSANEIGDLDAVMKSRKGPFLLHCATGARAALLLALSRARQNDWTTEQAFAEVKRMGFDLKTSPEFSTFVTHAIR
ncbi:MAG: sulfur transferase domain-containing protein [Casimicrobiaceae bacterium]